jgi:hypothetical protein
MPIIEREIQSGEALLVGDYKITPQAQQFRIRFPGHQAALIWNRPHAVIVNRGAGNEDIVPVKDVTRVVIWSMLAGGLLGAILIAMMKHTR